MNRVIALWFVLPLLSCATAATATRESPAADEALIRRLDEQERLSVLNRDPEALQRVWAEEFMVNSPFNQIAPNRAAVLDLIRQGLIHYSSFERTIQQLRVLGDIAIVMGAETVQPTGNAPLAGQTVHRRFTHIWRREVGNWRLIARHANNLPTR